MEIKANASSETAMPFSYIRSLRKLSSTEFKVVYGAKKRNPQSKALAPISVSFGSNSQSFQPAVHMFNCHTFWTNAAVIGFFFFGQGVLLGFFLWRFAIFVQLIHTLITAIRLYLDMLYHFYTDRLFPYLEIMRTAVVSKNSNNFFVIMSQTL